MTETTDGLSRAAWEHDWYRPDFTAYDVCKKCLIARRRDGKNGPCKGPAKLSLRGSPDRTDGS